MRRLAAAFADLLYPPRCGACGDLLAPSAEGPLARAFCPACAGALEPVPGGACARCADPVTAEAAALAAADASAGPASVLCPRCRVRPPLFAATRAAFLYGGPLLEAIHAFKYDRQAWLAGPLGGLLAARLAAKPPEVDLVVPVPLHARRLRERGFDQAHRLALHVGARLGRPVGAGLLVRRRATAPQVAQDRAARAQNLEGAFTRAVLATRRLRGRRVLLVDDVLTTGATAGAAARALLDAGTVRVEVAVLARAE